MATGGSKPLGQRLLERGLIGEDQLAKALARQRQTGKYLREILLDERLVDEDALLAFFEEEMAIPRVDLADYAYDREILALIPEEVARRCRAVPLFRVGDSLTVALEDPFNLAALDELRGACGCDIEPCACRRGDLELALAAWYGSVPATTSAAEVAVEALGREQDTTAFVQEILEAACARGASDVHIEPDEECLRVRVRVDGLLRELACRPLAMHGPVVSRVKILSDLDIAERRIPQDGRFQAELQGRPFDVRVSTFPTIHGENVVLRLLDKKGGLIALDEIGLAPREFLWLRGAIQKPNGIILVTGPTGSGKTTTLYSILNAINRPDVNIATLEDPIEYLLPMVRQTQVNEDIGFTFASGLRSLMRQDPDVILVGEIRDRESAEIAIRSAMTGHLVMSTLHTNDAVGTVARLMDMGVDPHLFASSLLGVVAQRLVRRLCAHCRAALPDPTTDEHWPRLERAWRELDAGTGEEPRVCRPVGCSHCNQTGYRGRVAIFELLVVSEAIERAIARRVSGDELRALARSEEMADLAEDGWRKVLRGVTSTAEVLRVARVSGDEGVGVVAAALAPALVP
jgi:type IV pilus assembly protein PilB